MPFAEFLIGILGPLRKKYMDEVTSTMPREDLLISVCFYDLPAEDQFFTSLMEAEKILACAYRFREIIVLADDRFSNAFLPVVNRVDNLRLLTVNKNCSFYERRAIAAEEAIGDVVVLCSVNELDSIDFTSMVNSAAANNSIIVAKLPKIGFFTRIWLAPLCSLARVAGFVLRPDHLRTMAMSRSALNGLIAHNDRQLALRFPPRSPLVTVSTVCAEDGLKPAHSLAEIGRRVQLFQRLLVYLAPKLLVAVALSSAALTLLGGGYAAYTLVTYFFATSIAPGWITTSTMLSLSAVFMGVSTLGLSLGLQQVLGRDTVSFSGTVKEINKIDLFGRVASELNIEVTGSLSNKETSLRHENES